MSGRKFYSDALELAERLDLEAARELEGLHEEIALLRLLIRRALEDEDPDDLAQLARALNLLQRLVVTQHRVSKRPEGDLAESLAAVIRSLGELVPGGG
jgi:hypothetical protein